MLSTHIMLVIALWIVVGIAAVLHRWGLLRAPDGIWVMRGVGMTRTGDVLMLAAFVGMTAMVVFQPWPSRTATVNSQPHTVNGQQFTVASFAVNGQPSAVYGSTIKDTYHRPECRYVKEIEHQVEWVSAEAAELAGKRPCAHCIKEQ